MSFMNCIPLIRSYSPFVILCPPILNLPLSQRVPNHDELAQMLELHTSGVPDAYRGLLPMLLKVDAWAQKGSVPGLVKLLKAFLARDAQAMVAAGQVNQVLGVVQQRLIPSKANDGWGFELLQAVAMNVPA